MDYYYKHFLQQVAMNPRWVCVNANILIKAEQKNKSSKATLKKMDKKKSFKKHSKISY